MDPYLNKRTSSPSHDATTAAPRKKPKTTPSGIAHPTRNIFDPWNSASTGHQRAENRLGGSTSWRDSRNSKLGAQYRGGLGGGDRVADTIGAGSKNFGKDGRKPNGSWEKGAIGLRDKGQKSLWESMNSNTTLQNKKGESPSQDTLLLEDVTEEEESLDTEDIPPSYQVPDQTPRLATEQAAQPKKQIFQNLCVYINGSTAPLISDHRLKYLLVEHGARTSIGLGRRSVTHVILGNTHGNGGAGGGLAGSKIQKEIARVRGKGIKFISVEWVLESIKAGKRLPEARFENLKLGGHGQRSVYSAFKAAKPGSSSPSFGGEKG